MKNKAKNILKMLFAIFTAEKQKEPIKVVAGQMAKFLNREYTAEERVKILRGIELDLFNQLKAEKDEAEDKAEKATLAMLELREHNPNL